jgi:hypothetical protein
VQILADGGTIAEARFTADACAICIAAASMLTEGARGMRVSDDAADRVAYARDLWPRHHLAVRAGNVAEHRPGAIVWPESTEEVRNREEAKGHRKSPEVDKKETELSSCRFSFSLLTAGSFISRPPTRSMLGIP